MLKSYSQLVIEAIIYGIITFIVAFIIAYVKGMKNDDGNNGKGHR